MKIWETILERALAGKRLNLEDGLLLFEADLPALGVAADRVCRRFHPGPIRTFVVDRNINYTNVCVTGCAFCAFSVQPGSEAAYVLTKEEILEKVRELVALGGTQVLLQGGLNPDLGLDDYLGILRAIRREFPQVDIHSFSPPEIDFFSRRFNMPVRDVLLEFAKAGLGSLPGGGAEILVDRVRQKISPHKISAERWIEICEAAHRLKIPTTATMVFGHIETREERVVHLLKLRELQDRTRGIRAFIPWSMVCQGTGLADLKGTTGEDYLRVVAISRLMLDNIPNIQAGWLTEGQDLAQVALAFGANDMGGILMEEQVLAATGEVDEPRSCVSDLIDLIRQAGFQPAQRNTAYQIMEIF